MDGLKRRGSGLVLVLLGIVAGCQSRESIESLDDPRTTLDAVGIRLSQSVSERRLTEIAAHTEKLLPLLGRAERDALGRGNLKFRSEVPIVVSIAAPESSIPFWIQDQGFSATDQVLRTEGMTWKVFRKTFEPGWIGLGVNGLDFSPRAHYVVFLQHATEGQQLDPGLLQLDHSAESDWKVRIAEPGLSASHDLNLPFETLPDSLNGLVVLQPSHDRRHSAVLASGRVWKTHVPSSMEADQIAISFGEDPSSELIWTWRTAKDVERTEIRIRPAGFESAENETHEDPDMTDVKILSGTSTLQRTPNLLNDPVIRRHVLKVNGLESDTTYLYSLRDGSKIGWGPWKTAKTGRADHGRVEFLYMGDAQTGLKDWGKRLSAAFRRHPGTDFILLAGDLVDRGNERTNWDHFFLRAAPIFDRIPVMPCAGNHEYLDVGPRLYRSFFTLPKNGPAELDPGLAYHFETGGVFVAVLDSTSAVTDPNLADRQAEWLDQALARSKARWKLVMFHHPVYPSHPTRTTPNLSEWWVPVFDRHRVDLVLQGHDHAYLRTHPMYANEAAADSNQGTTYVVAVSGDKFCDQPQRDYTKVGFTKTSTYQTIEVDDKTGELTYRSWTDAGEIADRLVLNKPRHDSEAIYAQSEEPTVK